MNPLFLTIAFLAQSISADPASTQVFIDGPVVGSATDSNANFSVRTDHATGVALRTASGRNSVKSRPIALFPIAATRNIRDPFFQARTACEIRCVKYMIVVARAAHFTEAISLTAWRAASFDAINLRTAIRAGFIAARSP